MCEGLWIGELTALRYLAGIFDNVRISLVIPSLTVQIEVVDVHILTKRGIVSSTAILLLKVTQKFWIWVFLLECLWWFKKCSKFTCCCISDMLTYHTGMINEKTTAKNRSYLKFWFSLWQQLFVQIIRQRDEILSQHPNRNFDELCWHCFSKLYMAATKTGQSIIFITHITIWHHYLCRKEFPTTDKKIKEKYWHMKRGPNFPDPPMN